MAYAFVAVHERGLPGLLLLSGITLRLSHCLIDAPRIAKSRAVGGLTPRSLRRVEGLIATRHSQVLANTVRATHWHPRAPQGSADAAASALPRKPSSCP